MQPTLPSIDSALGQRRDSPNAPPANTRVNSGSSSPIGGADHIRIVAVLQGHFPSPSPTPSNTRAASPQRGASIRPHTAGEATEMMDKLGDLAVERNGTISGPAKYFALAVSIRGIKFAKDAYVKITTAISPVTAFVRGENACNAGNQTAKDMLINISNTSNSSRAIKRDGNDAVLVSVADGSADVSASTKARFLTFYFMANLGLTLYNKYIMLKHSSPYLLTALHCLSGVIGTQVLFRSGAFTLKPLTAKDKLKLAAFSVLYTANIAISNASLDLVTVPFHQVVRAISPVFTVGIYHLVYGAVYSTQTYISLIPVMLGVGLATYGDYNATIYGFSMTLLGAVLAAVKTVVTNRLQTSGLHLGALELLYRMSSPALIQSLIMAYYHGEFDSLKPQIRVTSPNLGLVTALVVNGALAFALNFTSFSANKKVGALTMTVAANVKQILTVVLSVFLFNWTVSYLNICGIFGTIAGGAWYSVVELVGKSTNGGDAAVIMEEGEVEKS